SAALLLGLLRPSGGGVHIVLRLSFISTPSAFPLFMPFVFLSFSFPPTLLVSLLVITCLLSFSVVCGYTQGGVGMKCVYFTFRWKAAPVLCGFSQIIFISSERRHVYLCVCVCVWVCVCVC